MASLMGREVGERTRCRTCNEPIFWMETDNGRLMPVDTKPELRLVRVLSDDTLILAGGMDEASYVRVRSVPTYTSHFASCVNADLHRRR